MKSRIAIQHDVDGPVTIDEMMVPDPEPDQVTIKLYATGLCHSQLHQMGATNLKRPLVLGHEATGIVTRKGKSVTHVDEGDNVIVTWITKVVDNGDTKFMSPLRTISDKKIHGILIYTWAEEVIVRGDHIFPISKEYPTDITSILGCAVATGFGAVVNTAQVRPGSSVAVFGVGGVGLSAINTASVIDAYPIIAVDLQDEKLDFAKEFGATHVVNASKVDPVDAIIDISGGGVDYAFDTIGVRSTAEQLLPSTRAGGRGVDNHGGMAVLVGNPPLEMTIDPRHFPHYQRQYRGSHGASDPEADFPMLLRWHTEGKFHLNKLVSHRYSLDQINEAYDALKAGKILGRGIIEF